MKNCAHKILMVGVHCSGHRTGAKWGEKRYVIARSTA